MHFRDRRMYGQGLASDLFSSIDGRKALASIYSITNSNINRYWVVCSDLLFCVRLPTNLKSLEYYRSREMH